MLEVPVYIPRPTVDGFIARTVAPRSAIVGQPELPARGELLVVYYEGNLHGAANIVTFADRAMVAYHRMAERYPTVAKMAVAPREVTQAATLLPEHGMVEPTLDPTLRAALARWIGVEAAELGAQCWAEAVRA